MCKLWFVIITEYLGRDCMFTWKSELKSLNCCIYWTTSIILIKFAGYVPESSSVSVINLLKNQICYNSRDVEFFKGDYFLVHPVCFSFQSSPSKSDVLLDRGSNDVSSVQKFSYFLNWIKCWNIFEDPWIRCIFENWFDNTEVLSSPCQGSNTINLVLQLGRLDDNA